VLQALEMPTVDARTVDMGAIEANAT